MTVLVGLLSALTVTVGVAKPWLAANATVAGMPTLTATVTGADLVPLVGAMGFVLLAAFGAVLATSGPARRVVGGVVVGASLTVVWAAAHPGGAGQQVGEALQAKGWTGGHYDLDTVAWRWVVLLAGVACAAAGALVLRLGPQWATMGARYDAPGAEEPAQPASGDPVTEAELWRAIDRGHDPTAEP